MEKHISRLSKLFRFTAILYSIFGFVLSYSFREEGAGATVVFFLFVVVALFVFAVSNELVAHKPWARIAGIILSALYLPSALLPIGVYGLWVLLKEETAAVFKKLS